MDHPDAGSTNQCNPSSGSSGCRAGHAGFPLWKGVSFPFLPHCPRSFGRQHHLIPQVMEGQPLPDHHLRQRQIPGIPPSVYICRIDEVSSFPDVAIHNRQRSLLVHPAGKRPRSEARSVTRSDVFPNLTERMIFLLSEFFLLSLDCAHCNSLGKIFLEKRGKQ